MNEVPQTQASTAGKDAAVSKPTVMFVDDEERILRSLRMVFAPHYNVHVTTSGHKALALLKREKVHALVSDQRMPVMTGVELLRRAKEISPNTMRLLLTGYADTDAVMGSINEGEIFRYISKPWTLSKLRDTVKSAVEIAIGLEREEVPAEKTGAPPGEVAGCILLIDEDPETASVFQSMLERAHPGKLTIEWASTADSLFEILGRSHVSVVISDVRLGTMDITDLLKALKRHDPAIVTVIQTTVQDSGIMIDLINEAQIHRFLLKPVRSGMALRAIESGLERRAYLAAPKAMARQTAEKPAAPPDTSPMPRILGMFRGLMAGRKG